MLLLRFRANALQTPRELGMVSRRVTIVVPPFASIDFPMIGPSILASECCERGHVASVFYANLILASRLGYNLYNRISLSSFSIMLGDLLFREFAFPGECEPSIDEILSGYDSVSVSSPQLEPLSIAEVKNCFGQIAPALEEICQKLCAIGANIIGFSSSFQQNLAAISIAKKVKLITPEVITVFGGPNASNPMGRSLLKNVDCFDALFCGEADLEFANFVDSIELPAFEPNKVVDCVPIKSLDAVSSPTYSDYFNQLRPYLDAKKLPSDLPFALPIESSRGCWWGAKHHCTFCGLNGEEIGYRSKSPDRIIYEIEHLEETHGIASFQATDNIMPTGFVKNVLPRLAASSRSRKIFYEVKSNLRGIELDAFVAAGVTVIQPGIESFSSNILKRVDKGVSGTQNICLLRECASRQIEVVWNMLVAIPGDEITDYDEMEKIIPFLEHLHPPRGLSRIIIDRYSPYHNQPSVYGLKSVEPLPAYRTLYPRDACLSDIAYHFTAEYRSEYLEQHKNARRFDSAIIAWQSVWCEKRDPPRLYAAPLDDGQIFVEDTRRIAIDRWNLLTESRARLLSELRTPVPIDAISESEELNDLIERGFVIRYESRFVSIVVEPKIGLVARAK